MKHCQICTTELTKTQRKYCSILCKSKGHYQRSKTSNANTTYSQYKKADIRKKDFIKIKGGGCNICGYANNLAALHFHHLSDKTFSLDMRSIGNRSLKSLLSELDKCELLCANCHAETHHPELTLTQLLY